MPITVTFDIRKPSPVELNRIRGFFERLGWEHLGNTAYRYPKLQGQQSPEDWFNHVVPALMLLRAYSRHASGTGRGIIKFSLDAQSSTGCKPAPLVGSPPIEADQINYNFPSRAGRAFGLQRLQDWIDGIPWPYDPDANPGP